MSHKMPITKDKLDIYLKELAKEFRKLNGTQTPAEIVLVGGAAVVAGYGFRELTYDVDAFVMASSAMKEAISRVGDKNNLPHDWLNANFRKTSSYTDKLSEVSRYYRTFSNIVSVRIVTGEYLVAMKLMSGRRYKFDLSDVAGVLAEQHSLGEPITREKIDKAVQYLYGMSAKIPEHSEKWLEKALNVTDFKQFYSETRNGETAAKRTLTEFNEKYPGQLNSSNVDTIIDKAQSRKKSITEQIEANKAKIAEEHHVNPTAPKRSKSRDERE